MNSYIKGITLNNIEEKVNESEGVTYVKYTNNL